MAGVLLGKMTRAARIDVPGGSLDVHWDEQNGHVTLAGPTEIVYRGEMSLS